MSGNEDLLTPAQEKVRVKLSGLYVIIGTFLASVNPYAGMVVLKSAHSRSTEVVRACRHNKTAWKALENFVSGGDVIAAIGGHGVMIWAILAQAKGTNMQMFDAIGYSEEKILGGIMGMMQDDSFTGSTGS